MGFFCRGGSKILLDPGRAQDAPDDIRTGPKYRDVPDFSIEGLAEAVVRDYGGIDILVTT